MSIPFYLCLIDLCDQLNSGIICPAQQHEVICNNDITAELINRCRLCSDKAPINLIAPWIGALSDGSLNNELMSSLINLEISLITCLYIFCQIYECFTNTFLFKSFLSAYSHALLHPPIHSTLHPPLRAPLSQIAITIDGEAGSRTDFFQRNNN